MQFNYALLSNEGEFTIFRYGDSVIRFKAPYSLEKYTAIKEWDKGYLVVMAKYKHNKESEEEYIDLIPILEKLYIAPEEFLRPIKGVKIEGQRVRENDEEIFYSYSIKQIKHMRGDTMNKMKVKLESVKFKI